MPKVYIKRGTRSQLDAAAAASGLNIGEPYLITDEGRIAIGLSLSTYQDYALKEEVVPKRTRTEISSGNPTINVDITDIYGLTAQAIDISSVTITGTPRNGQLLWIYIIGTAARAITWGSSFESSTVTLPTATVSTARLDVGFVYNSSSNKWRCVAVA